VVPTRTWCRCRRRAENGPRGTGTGDGKKKNAEEIENLRLTNMESFGTRLKQSLGIGPGRTEQTKQMTKREREMATMAMMREIDVRIERLEAEEPAANLPRAHVRTSRGRIWRPRRW